MITTITSAPATPASAYRPLQYTFLRNDETGAQVGFIRPATAGDVSTLANGLVLGDILVQHATLAGMVVGQTVVFTNCGSYNGIHRITKVIESDGAPDYITIDAPDYGSVTPTSPVGIIRKWLENFGVYLDVLVYTTMDGTPQSVRMRVQPDAAGISGCDVGSAVRRFFNHDIHALAKNIGGGSLVQDAHGITALKYVVNVYEWYVGAPNADPYHADNLVDEGRVKVAVNAIHPYHRMNTDGTAALTWATAGLAAYQVGQVTNSKFLTYAPRTLNVLATDRFRLHMLTNTNNLEAGEYMIDGDLKVLIMDGEGNVLGTETIPIALDDATTAFSVAVGPKDLEPFMTVPVQYRVFIEVGFVEDDMSITRRQSERITFNVDGECKEVRRPIGALNKLGGYDTHTFTGRETITSKVKRATRSKPMGTGTGYDHQLSAYAADIERTYKISSRFLSPEERRWVVENLHEQPNTVAVIGPDQVTKIVVTSTSATGSSTQTERKRVVLEYTTGVDNVAQNA